MSSPTKSVNCFEPPLEASASSSSLGSPEDVLNSKSQTLSTEEDGVPTGSVPPAADQSEELDENEPSALDDEQRAALIEYLEHRVRDNVRTVNARDWDALRKARGISPDFRCFADGDSRPMTWQEMVNHRAVATRGFPGASCRIIDLGTHLNAAADYANVFTLLEIFHPHIHIRGEKMMVYEYSKIKGLWLHSRRTSLRAPLVLEERGEWFGNPVIDGILT